MAGDTPRAPNEPSPTALRVDDLTGPAGIPVLHHVSLIVPRSTSHVLLGPMHAGKSTLLRLVLGLERAESGTVTIDGDAFDAAHAREDELRRLRRRIGVVFDSSALVSRLTLIENVELPLVEHTGVDAEAARRRAVELLREAGLGRDLERTPDVTSRLDRRRTALARALVLGPRLLLIDEPGHGLDPHAAAELDDTLRALHERYACALLICSQEVRYAFRWPDAVSVLAGGRIVERGSLDQLLHSRHEAVRRFVDRRGAA
jgi:ABC-type transporter Mla maintaining outer membrane lipid asymmetry ATPase subunit MlaF